VGDAGESIRPLLLPIRWTTLSPCIC